MDGFRPRRRCSGGGIVELAIAMLLGSIVIAGALAVHQRSSASVRTAFAVARLQDTGRLALDVIETDVRMAGFWGRFGEAALIANRAGPGQPLPPSFNAVQGSRIDACGGKDSRWAIDLDARLDGTDNAYGLSCPAVGGPRPEADTLIVRRVTDAPLALLVPDRIHLQASHVHGALFVPQPGCIDATNVACLPDGFSPLDSHARTLMVRAYYVASSSTQRTDVPSLRRKSFGNVNAATVEAAVSDEEVVTGVEDLQVRFGIDQDGDGSVDAQAEPGAIPDGARVMMATIWLLVRAEEPEPGHVDRTAYRYANMTEPYTPGDAYRRVLVWRTFMLRNDQP